MIEAFTKAWAQSFNYTGRSNRGDYWWFVLANLIIALILLLLAKVVEFIGFLYTLYSIASIVPSLPLVIRRLRDAGKAWPWIFISLIPIIGTIWLIILLCQPSVLA
jgi:uncharacterized membrane protein YhaH (DUF805 family)